MPENNHFGFEELELWKKVRAFKKSGQKGERIPC